MEINKSTDYLKNLLVEDFNAQRLYEVVHVQMEGKGKVVKIRRVKLDINDITIEKIQIIQKKLIDGEIWQKSGKTRIGDAKYAVHGLKPSEVQKIILLKKVDKEDATNPLEYEKDLTKEQTVAQLLEDMKDVKLSNLEKLMNSLKERFANKTDTTRQPVHKSATLQPSKVKEKPQDSISTKIQPNMRRSLQETSQEIRKEQEEANEISRVKKRKQDKISQEMDEKSDAIRKKDQLKHENQQEIIKKAKLEQ